MSRPRFLGNIEWVWSILPVIILLFVSGCSSGPAPPAWQASLQQHTEAFVQHRLGGKPELAEQHWSEAERLALATANPDIWARLFVYRAVVGILLGEQEDWVQWDAWRPAMRSEEIVAYGNFLKNGRLLDGSSLSKEMSALLESLQQPTWGGREKLEKSPFKNPLRRLLFLEYAFRAGELRGNPEAWDAAIEIARDRQYTKVLRIWLERASSAEVSGLSPEVLARYSIMLDMLNSDSITNVPID